MWERANQYVNETEGAESSHENFTGDSRVDAASSESPTLHDGGKCIFTDFISSCLKSKTSPS